MRTKTKQPPLLDMRSRPLSHRWQWTVTYQVASSGYATSCHVSAICSGDPDDPAVGSASCDVKLGDDLKEVIECLAIESMLAACDRTLDGTPSHRRIVFSSNL